MHAPQEETHSVSSYSADFGMGKVLLCGSLWCRSLQDKVPACCIVLREPDSSLVPWNTVGCVLTLGAWRGTSLSINEELNEVPEGRGVAGIWGRGQTCGTNQEPPSQPRGQVFWRAGGVAMGAVFWRAGSVAAASSFQSPSQHEKPALHGANALQQRIQER